MDYLIVEDFLSDKTEQTIWDDDQSWKEEFELDQTMTAGLQEIPELDSAGLRRFAISTGAIVAVLFRLILPDDVIMHGRPGRGSRQQYWLSGV